MNMASLAIVRAFHIANRRASRFLGRNPDAYEETVDQLLIHSLKEAARSYPSTFPDGSKYDLSVRYCGRKAKVTVPRVGRKEVADILIALEVDCNGRPETKVLMIQSKRLFPRSGSASAPRPYSVASNELEEIQNYIVPELSRSPSTFKCERKYEALRIGDPQWRAIDAVNRLARGSAQPPGPDLVFYGFQGPLQWPTCGRKKANHNGDLSYRVLSQSDILGSKLCDDLGDEFVKRRSLLEDWIAQTLQCSFGYKGSGSDKLRLMLTEETRRNYKDELRRKLSDEELIAVDRLFSEGGVESDDFSQIPTLYLDAVECPGVSIKVTGTPEISSGEPTMPRVNY